jgi:hypothetical protein
MASTRFTTDYEPITGDIKVNVNFVKLMDTGSYRCIAENIYGTDETFMNIVILDVPNIDETPQTANPNLFKSLDTVPNYEPANYDKGKQLQPPIVIIPLKDLIVAEEKPITLMCKIIGEPKPKV